MNLHKVLAIKSFRITHQIHKGYALDLRHVFLIQAFANLHAVPSSFLGFRLQWAMALFVRIEAVDSLGCGRRFVWGRIACVPDLRLLMLDDWSAAFSPLRCSIVERVRFLEGRSNFVR